MVCIEVELMNSKERRKHTRKFPYAAQLSRQAKGDYNIISYTHTEMAAWCNEQFGKNNWKVESDWYFHIYKFKLEKHKTWFTMRWS